MLDVLNILDRKSPLFDEALYRKREEITAAIAGKSFLIIGAGGSIGRAVTKEIFKRSASKIHAVDLSENGLVELVRDIRSVYGYKTKEFDIFPLDCGSEQFSEFVIQNKYDFVLNLSAMKHVRSEASVYSMYRMIDVNILNTLKTYELAQKIAAKKYFCVSTDKAANPVNFMGATKRAMEMCLFARATKECPVSSARFANVAFSQGSLLEGFKFRIEKGQPISAPADIKRFFITEEEAGQICLYSALFGKNGEIYFPYNETEIKLTLFKTIVSSYLRYLGKQPVYCKSEDEARLFAKSENLQKYWPVFLFESDTTGEKPFEEFYTSIEEVNKAELDNLAYVNFKSVKSLNDADIFIEQLETRENRFKTKPELIQMFGRFMVDFSHSDTGKNLTQRM